jgi:hypothetical protein
MTKEYWKYLANETPIMKLLAAVLLCVVGVVYWMVKGFDGIRSSPVYWWVWCGTLCFGLGAWSDNFRDYQNKRKPWIIGIMALNCLPLILGIIDESKRLAENGEPSVFADLKGAIYGEFFAKEPPIKLDFEQRPGPLSLSTVSLLLVTNKSEKPIFPSTCVLTHKGTRYALRLPQIIKPYETIELPLRNNQTRDAMESGDFIEVFCENFAKSSVIGFK